MAQEFDLTRKAFSSAEKARFHNLLKMAAESPFEGERANALAAAERLAKRHGMSLDEAATSSPRAAPPNRRQDGMWQSREAKWARAAARHIHIMDSQIQADKARRDAAMRAAQARGLDTEAARAAAAKPQQQRRASNTGRARNQYGHAQVLLKETSLPLAEVASITGLDIYQVVGLKLKMRKGAVNRG